MNPRTYKPSACKQSIYLPEPILTALEHEAARLDRNFHWLVRRCVRLALPKIRALPTCDLPDAHEPEACTTKSSP